MAPADHAYSPLPDSPKRACAADRELDLEKLGRAGAPGAPGVGAGPWSDEYVFKGQKSRRKRVAGACLAGLVVLALVGGWLAAGREAAGAEEGEAELGATLATTESEAPVSAMAGPVPPAPMRHAGGVTSSEGKEGVTCTAKPVEVRPSNVNPHPRPPAPCASASERFLAFENHSGFHNQAAALANALTLAKLLNRTLLLPPARLGMAAPWTPTSTALIAFQEACKARRLAGDAFAPEDECVDPRGAGRFAPDHWTYVGWDLVMEPAFLAGHEVGVVDRWNSSQAWLELPRNEGGLGVGPDEVWTFEDAERRSYQLYDSAEAPDRMGNTWSSRINIPDLLAAPLADKKVLQFGSLFGFDRIQATLPATRELRGRVLDSMILSEPALDEISDEIKARLGTYVGVHLRFGDRAFTKAAPETFPEIFRQLAEGVLGVDPKAVGRLLDKSAKAAAKMESQQERHARLAARSNITDEANDDEADDDEADEPPERLVRRRSAHDRAWWPLPASSRQPLSANMTCPGKLHPASSPLAALNTPVFLATDARQPAALSPFLPFMQHLPCLFTLDDFAAPSARNGGQPVAGLAAMRAGASQSEWDGLGLDGFLFGFLDAVVAAKGDAIVGTPKSTFSGYAKGLLHGHYEVEWEQARARAKAPGGMRW